METYVGINDYRIRAPHPYPNRRSIVTIGNFDGVHLGHQKLLGRVQDRARAEGLTSIAYTFRPHPVEILHPDRALQFLNDYEERSENIARLGLDVMIEEPFSREFSNQSHSEFFQKVLVDALQAAEVVVGYDFAFGKQRSGNLESLREFCSAAGIRFEVMEALRDGSDVISSTLIRNLLLKREVLRANRVLGRNYRYRGVVVRGDQRGRKLGFPTANQRIENKLLLPLGVYASRCRVLRGQGAEGFFHSVTNVGIRPTFQRPPGGESGGKLTPSDTPLVETHIIDKDEQGLALNLDLYGSVLEVEILEALRPEMKFSGVEELKAQIALDIRKARSVFALIVDTSSH